MNRVASGGSLISESSALQIAAGILVGLAPVKFGNPVVFEGMISAPRGGEEILIGIWPIWWAYALLTIVTLLAVMSRPCKLAFPKWLLIAGATWIGWQFVSATQSIDAGLTRSTLKQFVACGVCFLIGGMALAPSKSVHRFWIGVCVGLGIVVWAGVYQRLVGMDALREIPREELMQLLYDEMGLTEMPPLMEFRMMSDRVYSTLVYPNALAIVLIAASTPSSPTGAYSVSNGGHAPRHPPEQFDAPSVSRSKM